MKKYLIAGSVLIGTFLALVAISISETKADKILINKCKQAGKQNCECTVKAVKSILTEEQFKKIAYAQSQEEIRIIMMSLDFSQLIKIGYIEEVCE